MSWQTGHQLTIRLTGFEGPLDLLLALIHSQELPITEVSLCQITDPYVQSLQHLQELNFDVASEFLVLAATLLHWKSKALLPPEPITQIGQEPEALLSEVEAKAALLQQLRDHQRFLEAGQRLGERPLLGVHQFKRSSTPTMLEKIWRELDSSSLALAYQRVLQRSRQRTQVLQKETVSLTEKMIQLSQVLPLQQLKAFGSFFVRSFWIPEVVATFLASLEMTRLKKLHLHQEGAYTELYLQLLEPLQPEDLQLALGFDKVGIS